MRPLRLPLALFLLAPLAGALAAEPRVVREYVSRTTGHFVLLGNVDEIALVDSGVQGPWVRTGYAFTVPAEPQGRPRMCRFYSATAQSHFFTPEGSECEQLRAQGGEWRYEHLDFGADVPVGGRCEGTLVPIYRLYNGRWRENDSNHRYTADPVLREDKAARGWWDEGIAFCALSAAREPEHSFRIATQQVRPTTECEDEAVNLGPCVALNQMPRLDNLIPRWAPAYSPRFAEVTGSEGQVHTAQSPFDAAAASAHSFAQAEAGSAILGLHVNAVDRTRGELASINPLYQLVTTPPGAGEADRRVFPWPGTRDSDLVVSFSMDVRKAQKLEASGHAYGHPTLQFRDVKSGQDVYVTMGTYGTVAPVDFVAMDESTQRVIVATIFRADPAFGKRLAGDYNPCDGSGACARSGPSEYRFRIQRADFAAILGKARVLHPHLSPEPADYLFVNFHFNNEIYRGAAIGATLADYTVEIFPAY